MNKRLFSLGILLIVIFGFIMLTPQQQDKIPETIDFEKIVSRDEIPEKIWSGLGGIKSLELKRGSYYFLGSNYETEGIYFLLCGGEDFAAGYDIEILEMKYQVTSSGSSGISLKFDPAKEQIFAGYFEPLVKEISTDSSFEYCKGFKYPFVVFKINTKIIDNDKFARKVPTTQEGVYLINQQNY